MSEKQAEYANRGKTIFRVEKNADNPFVMIDRRPIENPQLSWRAKGILTYLVSRPDNWIVRLGDLIKRSPDGVYAVRSAIKELTAAGHITRREERENGRFKQYVLEVHEIPVVLPHIDLPQAVEPQAENLTLNDTDFNEKEHGAEAPDVSTMPLDWQIGAGLRNVTIPDVNESKMVDAANLIATGAGSKTTLYYSLSLAFMKARNLVIPESKVKAQRKALKEMVDSGVSPSHVDTATRKLVSKGLTVVDLFSVSKTAIDLANKPEVFSGERSHAL